MILKIFKYAVDVAMMQNSKRTYIITSETSLNPLKRISTIGIRSTVIPVTIKQLRRTVSNDRRVMCSHLSMDISVMSIAVKEVKYVPHPMLIFMALIRKAGWFVLSYF